ncbi:MAG: methyltransferase [archaeon]
MKKENKRKIIPFKTLWKFIVVLIGMSGIRFDKGKILLIWIPLAICSYLLNQIVYIQNWWLPYAFFGWAFYYVGNALILGTPIRAWMIKKFGERKAYSIYEVLLGLMFMNGAFAIVQLTYAHQNTFHVSSIIIWTISAIVFIVSFGSKLWATWLTGLDIYYYKDLFLHKKTDNFVLSGPYKIFKNPMYGIGYLYGYLGALIMQSLDGLIFVAICHLSIYIFYFLVERPFVRKTYHPD